MPKFNIFYIIIPLLMTGSLFLPVVKYDVYTGGFFSTNTLMTENVKENGLNNLFCYFPLFMALLTTLIANVSRVPGTAIAGLVIMSVTVLYMPFEAFILTFTLFGAHRNKEVDIGFYLMLLSVLGFVTLMIIETVKRRRAKKRNTMSDIMNTSDLLDDF